MFSFHTEIVLFTYFFAIWFEHWQQLWDTAICGPLFWTLSEPLFFKLVTIYLVATSMVITSQTK
jgi:hypothetical protein